MDDSLFCEYSVKPDRGDPRYKKKKVLFILLYTGVFIFPVLSALLIPLLLPYVVQFAAVAALAVFFLVFFTWRRCFPEYEYELMGGYLSFSVIYHGRSRREFFSTRLSDAILIAPMNDVWRDKIRDEKPEAEYVGTFYPEREGVYFMIFRDESDKKCVFYFNADERIMKIFRRSCGRTYLR